MNKIILFSLIGCAILVLLYKVIGGNSLEILSPDNQLKFFDNVPESIGIIKSSNLVMGDSPDESKNITELEKLVEKPIQIGNKNYTSNDFYTELVENKADMKYQEL